MIEFFAVLKSSKIPVLLLATVGFSEMLRKETRIDDEAPGDNFPNILGNVKFRG
jgi:hypothetical protein